MTRSVLPVFFQAAERVTSEVLAAIEQAPAEDPISKDYEHLAQLVRQPPAPGKISSFLYAIVGCSAALLALSYYCKPSFFHKLSSLPLLAAAAGRL